MKIRTMLEGDRAEIVRMGGAFIAGTNYGEVFAALVPGADLAAGVDRLVSLVQQLGPSVAQCFVVDDGAGLVGMLAIASGAHFLSGALFAEEIAWWVEPQSRGDLGPALLDTAEDWARGVDCAFIKMIAPVGDPVVARYYKRRGYLEVETAFAKRL